GCRTIVNEKSGQEAGQQAGTLMLEDQAGCGCWGRERWTDRSNPPSTDSTRADPPSTSKNTTGQVAPNVRTPNSPTSTTCPGQNPGANATNDGNGDSSHTAISPQNSSAVAPTARRHSRPADVTSSGAVPSTELAVPPPDSR